MTNPWIECPLIPPFVLSQDKHTLDSTELKGTSHIRTEVMPTPFIGNPLSAKVIVLALNPGFNEEDLEILKNNPKMLQADKNNLLFKNSSPFYALDERYNYSGLFKWWDRRLKAVTEIAGRSKVMNNVSCIQFFPYHSVTYSPLKKILPSQEYSFYLVRKAIKQNKLITVMRSKSLWEKYVPELSKYPVIELKVPRNPYFNSNNMTAKEFEELVNSIKS